MSSAAGSNGSSSISRNGPRLSNASIAGAALLDLGPAVEPPFDLFLEAAVPRLVVRPALERGWQAGHLGNRVWLVVGVLVVLAVFELLHQLRRSVSQVQRNRLCQVSLCILGGAAVRFVHSVAL